MLQRPRFPWLVTLVVVWLVAPLALVGGLTWVSWQQTVYAPAEPVWVSADDAGGWAERRVQISLTWSEPSAVLAPEWSGLVREVWVAPGAILSSGDAIARVGGTTRLAWHSSAPFYRPLMLRATGDDVAALNSLLRSRDLPADDADVFTWETRRGVIQLGKDLGADDSAGVFDPALVVYLPTPEVRIAEVQLQVGAPVPSAGASILTSAPTLVAGVITVTGADTSASDSADLTVTAASDEVLTVSGTALELADTRDRVGAEALAQLSNIVTSEQEVVVASLRRELPNGSVRVPSAAVHTGPDGTTCIVIGSPTDRKTVVVDVTGGLAGETVVTGGVTAGDQLAIGALAPGAACG